MRRPGIVGGEFKLAASSPLKFFIFRPRPSLTAGYSLNWHPRRNHFKRPELVRRNPVGSAQAAGAAPGAPAAKMTDDLIGATVAAVAAISGYTAPSAALLPAKRAAQPTVSSVARLANDKETWRRMKSWRIKLFLEQLVGVAEIEAVNLREMTTWVDGWDELKVRLFEFNDGGVVVEWLALQSKLVLLGFRSSPTI